MSRVVFALNLAGEPLATVLTIIVVANGVIFATLAVWAARTAVRDPSPRLRTVSWVLAAVALAFVLGAVSRLAALAVRQGWLPGTVGDFLVSEWLLLQALAATALGVTGLVVARRVAEPIRAADRIVAALADRVPKDTNIADLKLTARELDVIAVIAAGKLSDKDIGEELFISPATAGTHVKNIMRKAAVSSRRELALLTIAPSKGPTGTR